MTRIGTQVITDEEQQQLKVAINNAVEITPGKTERQKKIRKEIEKQLQFYLDYVDKLIEGEDFSEIDQVC